MTKEVTIRLDIEQVVGLIEESQSVRAGKRIASSLYVDGKAPGAPYQGQIQDAMRKLKARHRKIDSSAREMSW